MTDREKIENYLDMLEEDELFDVYYNSEGWDSNGKFYGFYQGILDILRTVERLKARCEVLQKNYDILKEEKWRDEELQRMKRELDEAITDLNRGFEITKEEDVAIKEWIDVHIKEKHNGKYYAGTIGGRFTYGFTPTSIGTVGTIRCSCGDSFTFRELRYYVSS